MKVADAAKRLEVSSATVYSLIDVGHLGCRRTGKTGRAIRITEEQLQEYIDSTIISASKPESLKWIK